MAFNKPPNILDIILEELCNLKDSVNDLKKSQEKPFIKNVDLFKFMPIEDIFDLGLMSPSTFYKYAKEGVYKLYKFGGLTFVDRIQFESAFREVKLYKK
jgi:hypothetical protein